MGNPLEWEGVCRGVIVEHGLFEADSGAEAVNVVADIHDYYDTGLTPDGTPIGWENCRNSEYQVEGSIWIIKKDGTINQSQAKSLMQFAGWDGDLAALDSWRPTPCSFTIQKDTYRETIRYRIAWINGYDDTPGGGLTNVSPDRAKELQGRYGSQFRALAGNVTRATVPVPQATVPVPQGAPVTPKPTKPVTPKPGVPDDGIPF